MQLRARAEKGAECADAGQVCRCEGFHVQRSMRAHIVSECGPIGGVGAVYGNRDGRGEHFRGVPQAAGDEEDLAGMKAEAHGDGSGE